MKSCLFSTRNAKQCFKSRQAYIISINIPKAPEYSKLDIITVRKIENILCNGLIYMRKLNISVHTKLGYVGDIQLLLYGYPGQAH